MKRESIPGPAFDIGAEIQKANAVYPSWLRKGSKEDVPNMFHLSASFFETVQDKASQILTYSDDEKTVTRLAKELYEEASRRLK